MVKHTPLGSLLNISMKTLVLFGLALSTVAATAVADEPPKLSLVSGPDGVVVREAAQDVLSYQRTTQSKDGKHPRANYVHPLFDLDGHTLTEDFPDDHRHHRGVFWAWHQVWVGEKKIGDAWACQDFEWDVRDVKAVMEGDHVELRAHVLWKSPQWTDEAGQLKPLVEENTTIRVHRSADDARKIDFEVSLRAIENDLRLGGSDDEKGYGGFSVRVRLPEGVQFHGEKGAVEPQTAAVEAGPWLDITGRYGAGEEESGVAILCHRSLPGFPQPWILRRERSMQNPVFPGREPVMLSTEEPLMLRYRLVLHRGAHDRERVQAWFAEYAK